MIFKLTNYCLSFAMIMAASAFSSSFIAADDAENTGEVKAGDISLTVPKSWKQQQPSNNLRLAQFVIPAAEGSEPGELVVSGPFGGSAADNIQRWVGQFSPEGREMKMMQGESEQGKYVLVDMTGTYLRSIGPPIRRQTEAVEGYRVINVMVMTEAGRGGNYFLKLTGPKATIDAAVDQLRHSIGAKASEEKPYEL